MNRDNESWNGDVILGEKKYSVGNFVVKAIFRIYFAKIRENGRKAVYNQL